MKIVAAVLLQPVNEKILKQLRQPARTLKDQQVQLAA